VLEAELLSMKELIADLQGAMDVLESELKKHKKIINSQSKIINKAMRKVKKK